MEAVSQHLVVVEEAVPAEGEAAAALQYRGAAPVVAAEVVEEVAEVGVLVLLAVLSPRLFSYNKVVIYPRSHRRYGMQALSPICHVLVCASTQTQLRYACPTSYSGRV